MYVVSCSVEKFIHQSAIQRVVREQKEATLRYVQPNYVPALPQMRF